MVMASLVANGQKQLVILKGEKVVLRLNPGDEFNFSLKDKKGIQRSYINNLFDTAVMVHKLIVPFHKIDKIYFKQYSVRNLIGKFLVVAGVGYFLIDQVNVILVNGDGASLNKNVTNTSIALVAVGLPMMLMKKKFQRIGSKYKLYVVEEGSPFYIPSARQF
jgi:hypothetical protein